jgi:hypothetical protein
MSVHRQGSRQEWQARRFNFVGKLFQVAWIDDYEGIYIIEKTESTALPVLHVPYGVHPRNP